MGTPQSRIRNIAMHNINCPTGEFHFDSHCHNDFVAPVSKVLIMAAGATGCQTLQMLAEISKMTRDYSIGVISIVNDHDKYLQASIEPMSYGGSAGRGRHLAALIHGEAMMFTSGRNRLVESGPQKLVQAIIESAEKMGKEIKLASQKVDEFYFDNRPWYIQAAQRGGLKNKRNHVKKR